MPKRGSLSGRMPVVVGLTALLVVGLFGITAPVVVLAAPGDVGFQGPSFNGVSVPDPTSSKPESKVWFNDGSWWATMYRSTASAFTIHRLSGTSWVDTGVAIDDRESTHQDALWDPLAGKLYIASHVYNLSPASGNPARLYRYSYNAGSDTYSLDASFPQTINNWSSETLVIDKDSTGQLWATWTRGSTVRVNRTTNGDQTWGAEFVPSVSNTGVASDDISTLVAFGGDKIGLFWSKQNGSPSSNDAFHFSIHQDSAGDTTWGASTAVYAGTNNADDHINLKADPAGNLYAVVKTSQSGSGQPNVVALRRAASNGAWTNATVINRASSNQYTRGIAVVDTANNLLHVFATNPESNGTIYEKTSPLNALSFTVAGLGTQFIRDNSPNDLNNATTSKQVANSTSGMLVLAGHETLNEYWWNLASFGPPPNTPPTASPVSKSTPHDVATTINLAGTDAQTCDLTFAIGTGPAHGTLGSIGNAACVAGSPNSDSATVLYTPTGGYSGLDTFTYTVNDGTNPPVSATVTLTVTNAAPTATGSSQTTPEDTLKTLTLSGGDVDNCELTFAIATGPTHGGLDPTTPLVCSGIGPFTDTATVDYTPTSGFNGPDSFTFTVSDGVTTSAAATVSITVGTPPNAPPTASPVSKSTPHDVAATINLAGTDAETCQLTFVAPATGPSNGSLGSVTQSNCVVGSPNSDSASVVYTPDAGYSGPDSFTYTVNDGTNPAVSATVTLTVTNASPSATGSSQTTTVDNPVTFNLTGTDADDCNLTFNTPSTTSKGTLSAPGAVACTPGTPNTDRASITYTPNAGQTGADSFTFTVSDGENTSASATVNITINSGAPSTVTFLPVADAHVNTSNVNGNYGTLTTIKVREGLGTTADPNYRGYLKFNISGVSGTVSSVKLRLFVTDVTADVQSIFVVTDNSWTETAITYTTAPSLTGLTAVGSASAPATGYLEITLAPTTVSSSTTTLSLAVKSAGGNSAVYSSREDPTNKPQLVVTFQ